MTKEVLQDVKRIGELKKEIQAFDPEIRNLFDKLYSSINDIESIKEITPCTFEMIVPYAKRERFVLQYSGYSVKSFDVFTDGIIQKIRMVIAPYGVD